MMWWHQILVTYAENNTMQMYSTFLILGRSRRKTVRCNRGNLLPEYYYISRYHFGKHMDVRTMCSFGREEQMSVDRIGTERLEEYLVS